MARRPKPAKLAMNPLLREYVQQRLAGQVHRPDGTVVPGPVTGPWNGRNKPRRKDRGGRARGALSRSLTASGSTSLMMSRCGSPTRRSIRRSIVQGRGALKRELVTCLRTGRALWVPRARTQRGKNFVTDEIMISERPAEAEDRAVPGHWEGDLILGTGHSAIGTLVERSTRFTMLLHLPAPENRQPRTNNGPPVTGHGGEQVRDAIAAAITTLPEQLRRSLTWDQGAEMAQHAQLRVDSGASSPLFRLSTRSRPLDRFALHTRRSRPCLHRLRAHHRHQHHSRASPRLIAKAR